MIVLDENLNDDRIIALIEDWYPGRVIAVNDLRPGSYIRDEALPELLRQADKPTFVTINVMDFWRRVLPHPHYCIIGIELSQARTFEISDFLRRLFRLSDFKTRANRMGKVARVTPTLIEYYSLDRVVKSLIWPKK